MHFRTIRGSGGGWDRECNESVSPGASRPPSGRPGDAHAQIHHFPRTAPNGIMPVPNKTNAGARPATTLFGEALMFQRIQIIAACLSLGLFAQLAPVAADDKPADKAAGTVAHI